MQSGSGEEVQEQGSQHDNGDAVQAVKAPRGRTAYFIFAGEVREQVKQAHPGEWGWRLKLRLAEDDELHTATGASMGEQAKEIGVMWGKLSNEEKKVRIVSRP